jgi:hypothetical protein
MKSISMFVAVAAIRLSVCGSGFFRSEGTGDDVAG